PTLVAGNPLDNFSVVTLMDGQGNPVRPVDLAGNPIAGAVPVTRVPIGSAYTWYLGTTAPGDTLYYKKVGLPPGSHCSFQLYVSVAETAVDGTQVCNPASVTADVATEDLLDNNTSQSCTTVWRPDLTILKDGKEVPGGDPDFVEFGSQILY